MTVATQRVAAIVEYDGTAFAGLQRQKGQPTIQSAFESAAATFGIEDAGFRASGRTDAGVHARGQVIALEVPASLPLRSVLPALNWHLPESIRVRRVAVAPPGFDPRRHAIRRTYRYLLAAGQPFPPLMRDRMGRVKAHLDLELMKAAGGILAGHHDFRAWRSSQCQARRTELTLETARVEPWPGAADHGADTQTFLLTFQCRSFLHKMVRYLVAGIARAGSGELTLEELKHHLEQHTLPPRVAPADPCGLSLERVDYPPQRDPFLQLS